MDILKMPAEKLSGLEFDCVCGNRHRVEIKKISIAQGAINNLLDTVSPYIGSKILLVEDENTYSAAGKKVEEILNDKFTIKKLVFPSDTLEPDERAMGRILVEMDNDTGLIITVGSGVLNDSTRIVSARTNVPYMIIATAPSMDGYSSVTSSMIVEGIKKTIKGVYPIAIIADLDIMVNSPMNLIYAGLGDLLGKYTALCDWELAKILNNEFYCPTAATMIRNVIDKCIRVAHLIPKRDMDSIREISEAMILSGITISMAGSSRPVSGSEHEFSHCWEAISMAKGIKSKWKHGNEVGIGTGIMLEAYGFLLKQDLEKVYCEKRYMDFKKEKWLADVHDVYGERLSESVIKNKMDKLSFDEPSRAKRAKLVLDRWQIMKKIIMTILPDPEYIRELMINIGAPYSPCDLGIDRDSFKKIVRVCKDVRSRFSVMQLLEDMGLLEEFSETVTSKFYK